MRESKVRERVREGGKREIERERDIKMGKEKLTSL